MKCSMTLQREKKLPIALPERIETLIEKLKVHLRDVLEGGWLNPIEKAMIAYIIGRHASPSYNIERSSLSNLLAGLIYASSDDQALKIVEHLKKFSNERLGYMAIHIAIILDILLERRFLQAARGLYDILRSIEPQYFMTHEDTYLYYGILEKASEILTPRKPISPAYKRDMNRFPARKPFHILVDYALGLTERIDYQELDMALKWIEVALREESYEIFYDDVIEIAERLPPSLVFSVPRAYIVWRFLVRVRDKRLRVAPLELILNVKERSYFENYSRSRLVTVRRRISLITKGITVLAYALAALPCAAVIAIITEITEIIVPIIMRILPAWEYIPTYWGFVISWTIIWLTMMLKKRLPDLIKERLMSARWVCKTLDRYTTEQQLLREFLQRSLKETKEDREAEPQAKVPLSP